MQDNTTEPRQPSPARRPSAQRLEEIFGPEPGTPRWETPEADTLADERAREAWYRENRPPHHDER